MCFQYPDLAIFEEIIVIFDFVVFVFLWLLNDAIKLFSQAKILLTWYSLTFSLSCL